MTSVLTLKLFFCTLSLSLLLLRSLSRCMRQKKNSSILLLFFLFACFALLLQLLFSVQFLFNQTFLTLRDFAKPKHTNFCHNLGIHFFDMSENIPFELSFFLWLLIFQFISYTLSTRQQYCVYTDIYVYNIKCIESQNVFFFFRGCCCCFYFFLVWYKFRSKKAYKRSKENKRKEKEKKLFFFLFQLQQPNTH